MLKQPRGHVSFPSSVTDFLRFPPSGLCPLHPGEKQTFAWLHHLRETGLSLTRGQALTVGDHSGWCPRVTEADVASHSQVSAWLLEGAACYREPPTSACGPAPGPMDHGPTHCFTSQGLSHTDQSLAPSASGRLPAALSFGEGGALQLTPNALLLLGAFCGPL